MIRLILTAAVLAGLAVFALPDVGEPGSGFPIADVLRERACRVLEHQVVREVQAAPQLIDEIQTYEWCRRDATVFLVRRTFWLIDGVTTTRSEQDTPASSSVVLWECLGACPRVPDAPDLRSP